MMCKLNYRKLIGAFFITLSIILLVLSVSELFNKIDYVNEYKQCLEISDYSTNGINECKINASEGLGFRIRANQIDLNISQYLQVYLGGLLAILVSILLFILGKYLSFYKYPEPEKPKEVVAKKPVAKKKTTTAKKPTTRKTTAKKPVAKKKAPAKKK